MKKLLSVMLLMTAAFALCAQDIWVGGTDGKNVYLKSSGNKSYTLSGGSLKDLDVSRTNVYALVRDGSDEFGGSWTLHKNNSVYSSYNYDDRDTGIMTSAALYVEGNSVVVAGVIAKRFNDKGYEARMFGDVNKSQKFLTDWKRKSLKREYFRGFSEKSGSKLVLPESRDEDATYNMSLPFAVKAVKYYDGHIFTTGWGEREYSLSWGHTYYFVRRVPRAWMDGEEKVQQYENRTGAAYSIDVSKNSKGNYVFHTSGHERNDACAWDDNVDMFGSPSLGAVTAEAISKPGTDYEKRIMVVDKHLYLLRHGQKQAAVLPGAPSQLDYYDVEEIGGDVMALGRDRSSGELVVLRVTSDLNVMELFRTRLSATKDFKIGVGY